MVAEARTAVDVEGAVREWCRAVGFVTFFGVNNNGTFPQVIVQRLSGPDDDCLIQFDVWASEGGGKQEAAVEAASLATQLTAIAGFQTATVRLHDADWLGSRWLPDEATDRPRYIVEAVFYASAI